MGLREQAKLDAQAILEDTLGFAWPVTLTSPLGVVTSLYGFTTDVGQTIDPETGQAVAGQRASVSVARASLPSLPEAVHESSRKPWVATFADSQGVSGTWKVIEVLPDRALGVVVLLLEVFQRAIVHLTGALALPSLEIDGTVAPEVPIDGALELPMVELAGELAVTLEGSLALPPLALSGSIAPAVSLGGSLTLPSLALAGTITVTVRALAGSLALPMLQLAGTLTTGTNPISAMLDVATATVTGSGYSSVPDLFNGANPAVQATDAARPVNTTSANSLPIADYVPSDFLGWPAASNINQTTVGGFGMWIKFDSVSDGVRGIIAALGGATSRFELIKSNGDFIVNVNHSQFSVRRGAIAAVFAANTWYFITWEFDPTGATDAAKCTLTVNGTVQTLTFTNDSGTPNAMPAALVAYSGTFTVGARNTVPLQPLDGKIGTKLVAFGAKLSGATQGLLTTAARAAIMAYFQPT